MLKVSPDSVVALFAMCSYPLTLVLFWLAVFFANGSVFQAWNFWRRGVDGLPLIMCCVPVVWWTGLALSMSVFSVDALKVLLVLLDDGVWVDYKMPFGLTMLALSGGSGIVQAYVRNCEYQYEDSLRRQRGGILRPFPPYW
jgi:hypothetical protein